MLTKRAMFAFRSTPGSVALNFLWACLVGMSSTKKNARGSESPGSSTDGVGAEPKPNPASKGGAEKPHKSKLFGGRKKASPSKPEHGGSKHREVNLFGFVCHKLRTMLNQRWHSIFDLTPHQRKNIYI